MDTGRLQIPERTTPSAATSSPCDALAAYAREWPDFASNLVGGEDIGDGSTYRLILQQFLDRLLRGQSVDAEYTATVQAMRAILNHPSATQFKLALAADGRTATEERLAQGVVHAFWGVSPIINLIPMAEASRRLGIFAETFCYRPYHVTSGFDVTLTNQWEYALKGDYPAYSWLVFVWAMLRYDIFHTFFDTGILQPNGGYGSPNFGPSLEEMQLLRAGGKRLYCMAYGADNRTRQKTLSVDPVNFCMHCPSPGRFCVCSDENAALMFSTIDQYTTANLASGLSTDYVPNSFELHYLVLDTETVRPSPLSLDASEPLRIFHAPNHPHFKGSMYLMDAVDQLKREGAPIELKLVSGVPQAEVVEEMRRAHVVADQFIGGFYGQTAIEAMALGRPVLCYLREPQRAAAPCELPIINCHPQRIRETLLALLADRPSLSQRGVESRRYVEQYHSLEMFAHRLRTLYEATAGLPDTVVLAEAPSPTAQQHELKLLNELPAPLARNARNEMRDSLARLIGEAGRVGRADAVAVRDENRLALQAKLAARTAEAARAEIEQKLIDSEAARLAAEERVHSTLRISEHAIRNSEAELQRADQLVQEAQRLRADAEQRDRETDHRIAISQQEMLLAAHQIEGKATRAMLEAEQSARQAWAHAHEFKETIEAEARERAARDIAAAWHAARVSREEAMRGALAVEQMRRDEEGQLPIILLDAQHRLEQVQQAMQRSLAHEAVATAGEATARAETEIARKALADARAELDALEAAKRVADARIKSLDEANATLKAQLETLAAQTGPRVSNGSPAEPIEPEQAPVTILSQPEDGASVSSPPPVADAEARLADIGARSARVGQTLRRMHASLAWRLTAPLRALSHLRHGLPKKVTPTTSLPRQDVETDRILGEFEKKKGRALRVLHIGNVANNAYNNAKIQRRAGIDADVLCIDDYYIMASPEWEEVDFRGDVGDPSWPDWKRVDLGGYKRPKWFAQGPADPAIRYLMAKSSGASSAGFRRKWLDFERSLITHRSFCNRVALWLIRSRTRRNVGEFGLPANAILLQYFGAVLNKWARLSPVFRGRLRTLAERSTAAGNIAQGLAGAPLSPQEAVDPYLSIIRAWRHPYFAQLLAQYDVVQCYGTYTAIPHLAGHANFVAYEHGTLRAIPFIGNGEGQLCAASYKAARCVFVTNSDNLEAARRLGIESEKIIALPHAVDSERLLAAARKYHAVHRPVTRFFMASRQHWVDGDPGWAKANDRAVRALALVRASGRTCELHMIDWGKDANATKELARELGVDNLMSWKAPIPKASLWREFAQSDAVLDQFLTPSLGGVTFEAMLLGRRVISRIDPNQGREFFGECPPIYNCTSIEEIAEAMMRVIDDPTDLAGDGQRNQMWAAQYHSSGRIVALQVAAYQKACGLLIDSGPGGAKRRSRLLTFRRRPAPAGARVSLVGRVKQRAGKMLVAFTIRHADTVLAKAATHGAKSTRRRLRSGRLKSLWGVTPILTLPLLVRCDAMLGFRSRSLVFVTYYISRSFDINLSKLREFFARDYTAHVAFLKWVMAYALLRYDVFHFFYDRGILMPPNGRIQVSPQEMEILKGADKRIYTYAYGADVRTRETTLALGKYNFCVDCDAPHRYCICSEEQAKANIDGVSKYANAMISMIDMIHYVPGCRNAHYWPMDVGRVRYVGTHWDKSRPVRLLHAPNHMHFKGSRYLIAAVEKLQAEGVPIELKTISGVSNAEVLKCMAEADVVAEQFIGGAYGYTAIEAWAMGKPVLTYVRDDTVPVSAADFPGINTNPDTIYETLKAIAHGQYDLQRIGQRSRRYVERHYSLEAIAITLGRIYLETGNFPERIQRRLASRVAQLEQRRDQRLGRPLPGEASGAGHANGAILASGAN